MHSYRIFGKTPLRLDGGFAGTLVARDANIELSCEPREHYQASFPFDRRSGCGDYRGAFFGKAIRVGSGVHVSAASFPSWKYVRSQDDLARGPLPSPPPRAQILRTLHQAPPLEATGAAASPQAAAFLDWVAAALPAEDGDIQTAATSVRHNSDIATAFASEVEANLSLNYNRSLSAMWMLSSMRAPSAEAYLAEFANRAFAHLGLPTGNPDGLTQSDLQLASLESFAVIGLAGIRSTSALAEVLRLSTAHPALMVRFQAVRAYLRNGGNSARADLQNVLPPRDWLLLDQFRRSRLKWLDVRSAPPGFPGQVPAIGGYSMTSGKTESYLLGMGLAMLYIFGSVDGGGKLRPVYAGRRRRNVSQSTDVIPNT